MTGNSSSSHAVFDLYPKNYPKNTWYGLLSFSFSLHMHLFIYSCIFIYLFVSPINFIYVYNQSMRTKYDKNDNKWELYENEIKIFTFSWRHHHRLPLLMMHLGGFIHKKTKIWTDVATNDYKGLFIGSSLISPFVVRRYIWQNSMVSLCLMT